MVQTDLFITSKASKKAQLLAWFKVKGTALTSEVCRWGLDHYSPDRATRNARQLAKEGYLVRMNEQDMATYYPGSKEGAWAYTGKI